MLATLALLASAHAATLVGGSLGGADLLPANGDVLQGTFTDVGLFRIPAGARVFVADGVPLVVNAGTVEIDGVLDGDGAGYAGGFDFVDAAGPGGGEGDESTIVGGGGGGNGGAGGRGDPAKCPIFIPGLAGGAPTGTPGGALDAEAGSGGGQVWGVGGDGGATITLNAVTIDVAGTISVAGDDGDDHTPRAYFEGGGASGGGAGGTILLDASGGVTLTGVLDVSGGAGGLADTGYCSDVGGGGGGGGGRIKVFGPLTGSPSATANGGRGGSSADPGEYGRRGEVGTIWLDDLIAGPPAAVAVGVCGAATLTVTGGTPFGQVRVLTGTGAGADVLPVGECAGIVTGLAGLGSLGFRTLDASGALVLTGTGPACGGPVQVVDLWSCTTGPVVVLP